MFMTSSSVQERADQPDAGDMAQESIHHLKALYRLVDRLHRAESLSDVCGAAIDALTSVVRGQRAAVFLSEHDDRMRCVAMRGLSPGDCSHFEASLPQILRHVSRPVCAQGVDDLGEDAMAEQDLGSLCFAPLGADDELIGALFVGSEARVFDEDDVEAVVTVARHVSFAVSRRRTQERLREEGEQMRRDLLERRRIERTLLDNEHRLRLALEAGRMGTWEWNIASGRMSWSPSLELLHGLPPGTFPGSFEAYQYDMHPHDRARVLASLERAVKRDVDHHAEYRIVLPDGTIRWIEAHGKLFREEIDAPARMIGICADITERKRDEEHIAALRDDLRRRVEELNALLDVLPVGVLVAHDPECRHMTMNPAAAALLGVSSGTNPSLSGPSAGELPFRVLRDGVYLTNGELPLQRAARSGKPVIGEVLEIVHGDGTVSSEYISAVPLFDEAGKVRGALGALVDMTERKRAEDALKAADRRKDEFLATLAHELRNPLAPIRNAIEILLIKGPPDPDVRWHQEVIDRQIRHMTRLLDDLLDVSRISYNKLELRRERVELSASIRSAIETSRPLVDAGRHLLTVTLPAEPVYLHADPVRLTQIFSNLLSNAAKYTEPGGHIEIRAERCGDEVFIAVSDDGIGIAPEMMAQIFGMFARGAGSLERSKGGLGVGLSLARGLVSLHGGSIEAHSGGPGQGSEFVVRIPLVDVGEVHDGGDGGGGGVSGRRILVVDDLRDSADSLATLLAMLGNETFVAYEGEDAIALAEKRRPDVVLLDIGMPRMDGYEVCRRLRARPWSEGMVIVALTGWGQQDDRRRSSEAGFDHHLVKPVEIAALNDVLSGLP